MRCFTQIGQVSQASRGSASSRVYEHSHTGAGNGPEAAASHSRHAHLQRRRRAGPASGMLCCRRLCFFCLDYALTVMLLAADAV